MQNYAIVAMSVNRFVEVLRGAVPSSETGFRFKEYSPRYGLVYIVEHLEHEANEMNLDCFHVTLRNIVSKGKTYIANVWSDDFRRTIYIGIESDCDKIEAFGKEVVMHMILPGEVAPVTWV